MHYYSISHIRHIRHNRLNEDCSFSFLLLKRLNRVERSEKRTKSMSKDLKGLERFTEDQHNLSAVSHTMNTQEGSEAADGFPSARRSLEDCAKWMRCKLCSRTFVIPVDLECRHTFCRKCLINYQQGTCRLPCPICNQDTVPRREEISALSTNRLVYDVVGVIKRHAQERADALNPAIRMEPAPDIGEQAQPARDAKGSRSDGQPQSAAADPGIDSGVHTDLALDIVMPDVLLLETDEPVHQGVHCNNCELKHIIGQRYCCGVCLNFNLCQTCFARSTELHDPKHVFVLLKQPQTNFDAPRPIFNKLESMRLQMSFQVGTTVHEVTCDKCRSSTIEGIRYKCGMCPDFDLCPACLPYAEAVHDPKHTFLAILWGTCYPNNRKPIQQAAFYI